MERRRVHCAPRTRSPRQANASASGGMLWIPRPARILVVGGRHPEKRNRSEYILRTHLYRLRNRAERDRTYSWPGEPCEPYLYSEGSRCNPHCRERGRISLQARADANTLAGNLPAQERESNQHTFPKAGRVSEIWIHQPIAIQRMRQNRQNHRPDHGPRLFRQTLRPCFRGLYHNGKPTDKPTLYLQWFGPRNQRISRQARPVYKQPLAHQY